ncbi:hypothetical protein [Lysobacter gummosus]
MTLNEMKSAGGGSSQNSETTCLSANTRGSRLVYLVIDGSMP